MCKFCTISAHQDGVLRKYIQYNRYNIERTAHITFILPPKNQKCILASKMEALACCENKSLRIYHFIATVYNIHGWNHFHGEMLNNYMYFINYVVAHFLASYNFLQAHHVLSKHQCVMWARWVAACFSSSHIYIYIYIYAGI